jgi:hypothetical protein
LNKPHAVKLEKSKKQVKSRKKERNVWNVELAFFNILDAVIKNIQTKLHCKR